MTRTLKGTITEKLPRELYRVTCEGGREITASVGRLAKQVTVKLLPGDRVTVEASPYDPHRGRITEKVS